MDAVISRIRLVAIYVGLLLPVIAFGAVNALKSSNNSPIDWVDATFAERRQYDEFVELFGPGDVVIASRSADQSSPPIPTIPRRRRCISASSSRFGARSRPETHSGLTGARCTGPEF